MPQLPGLRVFRSPIHGYGITALSGFQPGDVIADVEGVLYGENEIEDDTYCLWVDDGFYLDMVDQTRWINHSCDPNADIEAELDGKGGAWARIIALRPILPGDEITYHYGFPIDLAEPCACGASNCAGWIVDPDELPELIARQRERTNPTDGPTPNSLR